MADNKRLRNKLYLHIELLQNGETLDRISHPLRKKGRITFGSSRQATLSIPHYAVGHQYEIAIIDKGGVRLTLDPGWEGFINKSDALVEFLPEESKQLSYDLKQDDYGIINVGEIQILFKISGKTADMRKPVVRDPKLRGSLFDLVFDSKKDVSRLAGAAVLAAVVFGGVYGSLDHFAKPLPSNFADLKPDFIDGFFYPPQVETLPEAMQDDIDRSNILRSTINYYTDFAAMFAGWSNDDKSHMYKSSTTLFARAHEEAAEDLRKKATQQQNVEESFLNKPKTAIIDIPAVRGESLAGLINRIYDKADLLQENVTSTLSSRRETQVLFNEEDPYNETNYSSIKRRNEKKMRDSLSKIRRSSFGQLSDEEHMYRHAEATAKRIATRRDEIRKTRREGAYVEPSMRGPIAIPSGVRFASFLHNATNLAESPKIADLQGAQFGVKKPKKIKEPLIGEIDPGRVKRAIAKRKYELQICYELALRRNQLTRGKMEFQWRIDTNGAISDLKLLSSTVSDRNMERCVRRKIAGWKLPRPRRGSVEIRHPFSFAKGRG